MQEGLSWWAVIGLVLVVEGLLPFMAPGAWRKMFLELLARDDAQVRRFGFFSIALGLCVLWAMK